MVMGADTVERAHEIYTRTKAFLLKGGFNLRKWKTSDKTLQEIIDDKKLPSQDRQRRLRVMNCRIRKQQLESQVN